MPEFDTYNVRNEVSKFINEQRERYLKLLNDVLYFMNYLQTDVCQSSIYRLYSRIDNKNSVSNFKDTNKIALKLIKWRHRYGIQVQPRDIHDIIGASVVVYYEIDIENVISNIKECCGDYTLCMYPYNSGETTRRYTKYGYHAEHLVFVSLNPVLHGLKCEVQVKTLLHDAWHAKTHDLIYKPQGNLASEHKQIMESFGESIQAIEIQSQTIRKLVTQEWQEAEELRHVARTTMIDWMKDKKFQDKSITRHYRNILREIQASKNFIKNCNIKDQIIIDLIGKVEHIKNKNNGLRAAWQLMVYIASIRRDNYLNHIAKDFLRDWLKDKDNLALSCLYKSFAYYNMGERSEAIKELDEFLRISKEVDWDHRALKFNLLYYLIEEASCSSYGIAELRAQCDQWKAELEAENWEGITDDIKNGTLGYYFIVFGDSRDIIRKGINMCKESDSQSGLNSKFVQMHEEIGWRRYFNLRD